MKIFSIVLIVIVCLQSCNGGICHYKDIPFKATIVSIEKDTSRPVYGREAVSEPEYEVRLVSNIHDDDLLYKRDTLYLDEMTRHKITEAFLAKHRLAEGTVLEGTAHLITSGSCHPGKFHFEDPALNADE